MKVALYVTCLVDQVWPEVGESAVRLLEDAGCDVSFDPEQTCCGQPACNSGYPSQAVQLAKNVVLAFERSGAEAMVLPSGSCTAQIRHYPSLFADDDAWRQRALWLSMRTFELSWFLTHRAPPRTPPARTDLRVGWHDSCHALRDLGIATEGRNLLARVPGLQLAELDAATECCGFGGTFALKLPDISVAIADQKIASIARAGVEAVVGGDVSCLLHLRSRLERLGRPVRALHFAEILAGGLA